MPTCHLCGDTGHITNDEQKSVPCPQCLYGPSEYHPTGSSALLHLPDDSGLPGRGVLVEWHEGRVSAGLDGGPFIPMPIHVTDDGGGKYCTCRGADDACRGCPDCRAYEAELELDDAKAACAALNRTCVEGQEREREMEAQCAAMREALGKIVEMSRALQEQQPTAFDATAIEVLATNALAADAGREFYDRLMQLESEDDRLRCDLARREAEVDEWRASAARFEAEARRARALGEITMRERDEARRDLRRESRQWKAQVARLGADLRLSRLVAASANAKGLAARPVLRRLGQCLAALRDIVAHEQAIKAYGETHVDLDYVVDIVRAALAKTGKP